MHARSVAHEHGVLVLAGTFRPTTLEEARAFFKDRPIVVKAVAGGGGLGVRVARSAGEIEDAYARAASESKAAFGSDEVYVGQLVEHAGHIEVQIAGDRSARRARRESFSKCALHGPGRPREAVRSTASREISLRRSP